MVETSRGLPGLHLYIYYLFFISDQAVGSRWNCSLQKFGFGASGELSLRRVIGLTRFRGMRSLCSDALVEVKPGEVGMISGIPEQHLRRRVIIYSPARTASQQGSGKVGKRKINFLSTQKWENPLMGWTSTGDPYANVGEAGLDFDTQAAARAFAEKHGWEYTVKKRHTPLLKPKSYGDNFKWKGPPKSEDDY